MQVKGEMKRCGRSDVFKKGKCHKNNGNTVVNIMQLQQQKEGTLNIEGRILFKKFNR